MGLHLSSRRVPHPLRLRSAALTAADAAAPATHDPKVQPMRHLGEDPADRYGYRPSTAGYALHIVLPGARVEVLDGALVAEGWCGGGWVLPHDSGAPESWGGWPACIGCLPGYFQHIVLMQLGRAPAGLSDAALGRLLPDRPVKDALLHLVAADLVEPTMTAAGATYLIRPASRASVYLEPQS